MDEEMQMLVDLYRGQSRQGPGSDAATLQAIELAGLEPGGNLRIADIGCGTGVASTLLADALNASIVSVDFLDKFIAILGERAAKLGVSEKVETLVCDMAELPFAEAEFDAIWSEGAIYNIGFERGTREWARFLKADGILVASEITWTTHSRPQELQRYWDAAYPEIDTASNKIAVLEQNGYSPIGYFTLPQECWLDNYYYPLQQSFDAFLDRNGNSEAARGLVAAEREEIALYEKYSDYYSYGMYIARKL